MPLVVFLRGVNVGGHKPLRPSALAKDLAALEVKSFGAAGTFVVRRPMGQKALRAEVLSKLPFEADLMICTAREILDLAASDPFAGAPNDATCYISILAKPIRRTPQFPILRPDGENWQVKLLAIRSKFVISLHRRLGRTLVYPNEVVEKSLGVAATTRNWNTILSVCEALRDARSTAK